MVLLAVVDDDASILDALSLVLEIQGWCVRTYNGGAAFLADVENNIPDCLILDPHMPGVNGAYVAELLKKTHADIPIIGITARPTSQITQAVIDAGAIAMLTKPVTEEVLLEHIHTTLENDRK